MRNIIFFIFGLSTMMPMTVACSAYRSSSLNQSLNSSSIGTPTPTAPVTGPVVLSANAYNLGMNVPGLAYYNNAAIYSDIATVFVGNTSDWDKISDDSAAGLDGTGAPTDPSWTGFSGIYPSGVYSLTWDGSGNVTVQSGSSGTDAVTVSNGVTHHSVSLTLTSMANQSTNPWIRVQATPPVSNVHLVAPTALQQPGTIFLKDFIGKLSPFTTLRFMDALNTNGVLVKDWSQRSWPNNRSHAGQKGGMPYEDIVAIANQTGKDIWINIPVLATDDYVCRLARLLKYGEPGDMSNSACNLTAPSAAPAGAVPLNSSSKVYVEFSNEIWNWGFPQVVDVYCMIYGHTDDPTASYKTCHTTVPTSAIAKAALANSALPWEPTNGYYKTEQLAMILTKRDNDIFKSVFGATASQIRTVINVQAVYPAQADAGFQFMKAAFGNVASTMDILAVAPYFDLSGDAAASSVDSIFADFQANVLAPVGSGVSNSVANWLKLDLAEANTYGLELAAYEGGPGQNGATHLQNKITAQTDPRMGAMIKSYFSIWDQVVGRKHLFNYYSMASAPSQYGCFGALVDSTDAGSLKWDTLLSLTLNQGDANGDGVVDQSDCAILRANFGGAGKWWSQGDFNHDGNVDASDLAILNSNINGPACAAP